jgi:hypothetical protein
MPDPDVEPSDDGVGGLPDDAPDDAPDEAADDGPDEADDDDLQDRELSQEIELVGELVVAASDTEMDLSTSEIDRILGIGED